MTLQLYDLCATDTDRRFSPYCWRIKKALAHKGLNYETIPVPFTGIGDIPDVTPKSLPVLVHEGRSIVDSFAIAQYLEAHWPDRPSLFGGEGGQRAARFVEAWVFSTLHPPIVRAVVADIHNIIAPKDQVYFRQTREKVLGVTLEEAQADRPIQQDRLHQALLALDLMLRSQPFIGGEAPNFCDYIVYGSLKWPAMCSDMQVLPEKPRLQEWYAAIDAM